jgi:type IV secretion system protein VirD4
LYCALIGYIHYFGAEKEKNMNMLVEMINMMETREDDESYKNQVDFMFDELAEEQPQHFAVRQYRRFKLAAGVVCSKGRFNQASIKLEQSVVCGTDGLTARSCGK